MQFGFVIGPPDQFPIKILTMTLLEAFLLEGIDWLELECLLANVHLARNLAYLRPRLGLLQGKGQSAAR